MPLFKQERTIIIYAEAKSPMDLLFQTTVKVEEEWDESEWTPDTSQYTILHWSENIGLAKEIQQEEYDKVHNEFAAELKCPERTFDAQMKIKKKDQ